MNSPQYRPARSRKILFCEPNLPTSAGKGSHLGVPSYPDDGRMPLAEEMDGNIFTKKRYGKPMRQTCACKLGGDDDRHPTVFYSPLHVYPVTDSSGASALQIRPPNGRNSSWGGGLVCPEHTTWANNVECFKDFVMPWMGVPDQGYNRFGSKMRSVHPSLLLGTRCDWRRRTT